ncbi:MAG: hypothetical protein COT91_02815 [Candidatus Doudnabacteria bacterium CG10_big_fil_rev_8_21_14_0_10_41_10]|uniref:Uncharacterized protein n=1 Tax=Candidatus Doudnabacteria bacterium CG10_big_fil_rev_8_21_14_0_10_41_10 TaxID=1974551 RepID=A0A2H0VDJ2_9BACT|nr:MAG: hypothetical protein COT91_02815 [Candidatus Doudnabacteria bacterium CG10_big_fil_rev_8_21_14_0_10_41_10]
MPPQGIGQFLPRDQVIKFRVGSIPELLLNKKKSSRALKDIRILSVSQPDPWLRRVSGDSLIVWSGEVYCCYFKKQANSDYEKISYF